MEEEDKKEAGGGEEREGVVGVVACAHENSSGECIRVAVAVVAFYFARAGADDETGAVSTHDGCPFIRF